MAQLVIKAICLLENAGAKVDGLVSDGATSNRKLWSELGISGEKDTLKKTNLTILWTIKDIFTCFLMHPIFSRMYGIDYTTKKV